MHWERDVVATVSKTIGHRDNRYVSKRWAIQVFDVSYSEEPKICGGIRKKLTLDADLPDGYEINFADVRLYETRAKVWINCRREDDLGNDLPCEGESEMTREKMDSFFDEMAKEYTVTVQVCTE